MQQPFDRAAEDLGNSIHFEHVNVTIPDQRLATLFYVAGLGLTRDPYLMVSDTNMWVNVGRSQFHLPTARRRCCAAIPASSSPAARRCWSGWRRSRKSSKAPRSHSASTTTMSRRSAPGATACAATSRTPRASGASRSAFPMSSSTCRSGPRKRICAFYPEIMGMQAEFVNGDGTVARVKVGKDQYLQFRETDQPLPDFDGHHVQIYVTDFSGPYRRLRERGLVSQEDNQYQYRFRDIVDLDSGRHLFTVEHEVRSATHPMFMRPLVNRNPAETNRTYAPGHEQWAWAMGPDEYDRR